MKDISVSRNHAHIIRKDEKLFVVNKGSKFGTLLYRDKPLILSENKDTITLVTGKSLVEYKMEVVWSISNLFSCCKSKTNDYEYVIKFDELKDDELISPKTNNEKDLKIKDSKDKFSDSLNDIVLNIENVLILKDKTDEINYNHSFI